MFFTMENHENVSEQQLENQYVGQEFLNQTALKGLVWNNQSQSELGDKGDVIITSDACYTRKPLYDLIGKAGKGRVKYRI